MKGKILFSVLIGVIVGFALFAVLGAANDAHVEAAAEPTAALAIDPETGLPRGAVSFRLEGGLICIAMPGGDVECFCPCEVECPVCDVECPPCECPACIETAIVTDTLESALDSSEPEKDDDPEEDSEPDSEPEPEPTPNPGPKPEPTPEPKPEPESKDKGNNGHGNNEDGVDCSNPGKGKGGPNGARDPSAPKDDEGHGGGASPSKKGKKK